MSDQGSDLQGKTNGLFADDGRAKGKQWRGHLEARE